MEIRLTEAPRFLKQLVVQAASSAQVQLKATPSSPNFLLLISKALAVRARPTKLGTWSFSLQQSLEPCHPNTCSVSTHSTNNGDPIIALLRLSVCSPRNTFLLTLSCAIGAHRSRPSWRAPMSSQSLPSYLETTRWRGARHPARLPKVRPHIKHCLYHLSYPCTNPYCLDMSSLL